MKHLGPEGFDKIAIIGSAPSSIQLAPYHDRSWAVWACSPGAFGFVPRSEVWFEMHRFHPAEPGKNNAPGTKPHFSSEFTAFLKQHPCVMMNQNYSDIPNCEVYPVEPMVKKYGPYHFTSTIAWMLAMAIEAKPKAIGIWGVDMAATEEWAYQRAACQHWIGKIMEAGIQVILPPESDLMRPPGLYGVAEIDPMHIKITARLAEFAARKAAQQAAHDNAIREMMFLAGAADDANYMLQSWMTRLEGDPKDAVSNAHVYAGEWPRETPKPPVDVYVPSPAAHFVPEMSAPQGAQPDMDAHIEMRVPGDPRVWVAGERPKPIRKRKGKKPNGEFVEHRN